MEKKIYNLWLKKANLFFQRPLLTAIILTVLFFCGVLDVMAESSFSISKENSPSLTKSSVQYLRDFVTIEEQQKNISGTVTDATTKEPMPGVNVVVKGTILGALTDINGKYLITGAIPDDALLVFSFIGYGTQEVPIGGRLIIDAALRAELFGIDEVLVVGYGTQKKQTVTGAISSIRTETILSSPASNISSSIAGRIPGLISVQRSGEPGKDATTLKIRGIATLRTGSESSPLILVDGVERSTIDLIDPHEIESFNILKDASATAVFGVRGANGVILITTRTGKIGPPKINLSSNVGFTSYTMYPDFANAYEWATLYNEGNYNQLGPDAVVPFNETILQTFKDHSNPVLYPDVNWPEILLKPFALQQQHNINISGGTDLGTYFISFGFFEQEGLYREYEFEGKDYNTNPNSERYNLRTNFNYKITDNLTADLKMGTILTKGNYARASSSSVFDMLLRGTPHGSPGLVDGKLVSGYSNDPIQPYRWGVNPVLTLANGGYQTNTDNTFNVNFRLTYDLSDVLKGLSVSGMGAYDNSYAYYKSFAKSLPTNLIVFDDTKEEGYYLAPVGDESAYTFSETFSSRYRSMYYEATINYSNKIGNHSFTGLLMYNQNKINNPSFQYGIPMGYLGLVGRITYDYDNRYLFEVNAGYNGSEQFAEGKRFGFFPAFSIGWNLTEEHFFEPNKILESLKIRASYGEVGNDKTGGDRFLYLPSVYNLNQTGYYFGMRGSTQQNYTGATEGKLGNPDVTWERAKKFNIGLDVSMFDNKFSFVGEYFQEKRDNILWNYGTVPGLVGATLPAANLGIVENKGFEIESGWRSNNRNVNYFLKGNFTFARNKIIFMDEPQAQEDYLMQTGFPVGQLRGWRTEGYINTYEDLANRPAMGWGGSLWDRGERKFIDVNGDGVINGYDVTPVGYGEYPEIIYGVDLGIDWKGFSISTLFQGAANVTLRLQDMAILPLQWGERGAQKWHMGRWTEERYLAGKEITYPRMLRQNNESPSYQGGLVDALMQNANYLRLRNAEVAYKYSSKVLTQVGISHIRFYVNGRNLLTFTNVVNFDPEAPSGNAQYYPQQKIINVGLDIQF